MVRICRNLSFEDCVDKVRTREQVLAKEDRGAFKSRARSSMAINDKETTGGTPCGPPSKIPSIPSYILYKIEPAEVRRDIIRR